MLARPTRAFAVLAAALAMALLSPAAAAATDVDWFAGLRLSDGERGYLSISAAHFGSSPDEAQAVARRLPHPEQDLPVLLFLAAESGRPSRFVLDLRLGGLSWWEIRARLGVPPERVVVELPRDPGPPYGKAWGYYRNHPQGRKGKSRAGRDVILSDREFCDWVGARVLHDTYGVEPAMVLEARGQGRSLAELVSRQEQTRARARGESGRPGAAPAHPAAGGKSKGKGKGHGNGHGKSSGR